MKLQNIGIILFLVMFLFVTVVMQKLQNWRTQMRISSIKGASLGELEAALNYAINHDSRFTCDFEYKGSWLKVYNVRLREKRPYCGNHPNECLIDRGPNRRGTYLEGADWVEFNDRLNDVCDKMNISCSIYSDRVVWIRKGTKRRINYGSHMLGMFWQWDYHGEECDFEDWCDKLGAPNSSYPFGTPGLYERKVEENVLQHN
jgi:hypothetical protein